MPQAEDNPSLLQKMARAPAHYARLVKHALQILLQRFFQHDQLEAVRQETARMGSASVESVSYLRADVQRIEENVAGLRDEVAAMRKLLDELLKSERV
jgi:uncharacterized protein YlxW (UPF0749 family)